MTKIMLESSSNHSVSSRGLSLLIQTYILRHIVRLGQHIDGHNVIAQAKDMAPGETFRLTAEDTTDTAA